MSLAFSPIHHLRHHLDSITLEGLSPSAKADISKYIEEKSHTDSDHGMWTFLKYSAIAILVLSLLFCLIYAIYQWYKNKNVMYQPSPAMAGYGGYGAYQQNYPVMATPQQYGQYNQYGQAAGQFNQYGQVPGLGYQGGAAPVGYGMGAGYGAQPQPQRPNIREPPSPKLRKAKERDMVQSVTWKLDTEGKGR